jgi:hypothetical protein
VPGIIERDSSNNKKNETISQQRNDDTTPEVIKVNNKIMEDVRTSKKDEESKESPAKLDPTK